MIDGFAKVELATVQEAVSTPMIGRMRMQFWRDAVKGISDVRPLSLSLGFRPFLIYKWINVCALYGHDNLWTCP